MKNHRVVTVRNETFDLLDRLATQENRAKAVILKLAVERYASEAGAR